MLEQKFREFDEAGRLALARDVIDESRIVGEFARGETEVVKESQTSRANFIFSLSLQQPAITERKRERERERERE